MTALIFDTETTGIPRHPLATVQPRIIEFGGLLVDENGKILDEMNVLINPSDLAVVPGLLDWAGIRRITGLTEFELRSEPEFEEVAEDIRPFFERADTMISHNLPFDYGMFRIELSRLGITDWPFPERRICTVQEHAEEWGRRPKLTELYEYYTGQPLAQTHRALDDCKALLSVCVLAGVLK